MIPSYDEATAFLDDTDPRKRTKLIDRLLEDPHYAQPQADVWDLIYFGRNPPGFGTKQRSEFQDWLREQFLQNGSQVERPAAPSVRSRRICPACRFAS